MTYPRTNSPREAAGGRAGGTYLGAHLDAEAILSLASMEGHYDPIVAPTAPAQAVAPRTSLMPGYLLAVAAAIAAYLVHYLPFPPFGIAAETGLRHPISAAIIAILVGVVVRNTMTLPASVASGCKHIVKKGIPIAVVLAGAELNLAHLATIGVNALTVTILCVGVALVAGYYCARLSGLGRRAGLLLGAGTGICGNSAIVAVAPLIQAEDDDVAVSIAVVNLCGLLAMLTWPLAGRWLGLSDERFGVWSGTSIHAVPQVVAAGFAYSPAAGTLATLVKLVRVTLLAPLVFVLALLYARHRAAGAGAAPGLTIRYRRLVPWFVWGFLGLALLNSCGVIPSLQLQPAKFLAPDADHVLIPLRTLLTETSTILLTLAMAAIGLEVNVRQLASAGSRALGAGILATIALGAASAALVGLLL